MVPLVAVLIQQLALGGRLPLLTGVNLGVTMLSLLAPLVYPVLAIMLTLDAFTEEARRGTLKTSLFLPVTRTGLFLAKGASVVVGMAVVVGAGFVSALACSLFLPLGGSILNLLAVTASGWLAALLPLAMVIAMTMCLSQFVGSGNGVMAVMLLGAVALGVLAWVVPSLSPVLPTRGLSFGVDVAWGGLSRSELSAMVLFAWTLLLGTVGWIRFDRRSY